MSALALYGAFDDRSAWRWGGSVLTILLLHVSAIALAFSLYRHVATLGVDLPAVMIDMAPVASSPDATPLDLAPGPVMQEANAAPPPEATPHNEKAEEIPATPPQLAPEVTAPQKPTQEAEPLPQPPAKPEVKPSRIKPEQAKSHSKSQKESKPAPQTSASPRAERRAPAAAAVNRGSSPQAVASYNHLVAAHLQRFKQYPAAAKAAGQHGVARLSFTLGRSGQVLSSRLGGSSGHPALDAETLTMVRRAQPFPAFPPDVAQPTMSFSVPVAFSIR